MLLISKKVTYERSTSRRSRSTFQCRSLPGCTRVSGSTRRRVGRVAGRRIALLETARRPVEDVIDTGRRFGQVHAFGRACDCHRPSPGQAGPCRRCGSVAAGRRRLPSRRPAAGRRGARCAVRRVLPRLRVLPTHSDLPMWTARPPTPAARKTPCLRRWEAVTGMCLPAARLAGPAPPAGPPAGGVVPSSRSTFCDHGLSAFWRSCSRRSCATTWLTPTSRTANASASYSRRRTGPSNG